MMLCFPRDRVPKAQQFSLASPGDASSRLLVQTVPVLLSAHHKKKTLQGEGLECPKQPKRKLTKQRVSRAVSAAFSTARQSKHPSWRSAGGCVRIVQAVACQCLLLPGR